ncbi:MAG: DUF4442 domain-containing protein [Gammaproteobacteria bacterium]|nr:DUF4442 domain-containing protein [Gammaproteobacteria bacterium]
MLAQLLRKTAHSVPAGVLRWFANLWSPFFGAGIKITYISPDYRLIRVRMKLRWYNKNYVGTHFGGSMYAMTDPFYMLMLINILGRDYIVWDKGANIEFLKPGRSTLSVTFTLDDAQIKAIKHKADTEEKYVFELPVEVLDDAGKVVARVSKSLYVRSKLTARN